ncbi:chemotaxis protein CheW [Methylobacterium segetis]|uniref:chemotaxis protein CheW n=1 Tax=Methylobacterium segetis TaxID=2488750 RepID=UPI00104BAD01|nr:chemotaxis protein CheW [Methylobacterium segetis]
MSANGHRQDEAARARTLREARTLALARRGEAVRAGAEGRAFLVCACGPERYGLPLAEVAQVVPARPCTALPAASPALLGLVALSGGIVSVLDLARALGRGGTPAEEGHLVVLRGTSVPVALAVDRVLGTARLDGEAPDAPEGDASALALGLGSEAVSGYAPAGPAGTGDFALVDLPRLLRRYLP